MAGALCIDFGTSSIRIARRMPSGARKVIQIGGENQSTLDSVSIRSAIHVDSERKYVRYGEGAIAKRKEVPDCALYNASPKRWLQEPDQLGISPVEGLTLSREDLLTGLLANAISAAIRVMNIGQATFDSIEIRMAHPVWPDAVRSAAEEAMCRLSYKAKRLAFEGDWKTVTTGRLMRDMPSEYDLNNTRGTLVLEPIAAAVELLPGTENIRRVCVLVDVGAGTTDIGLFEGVVPDENTRLRQRLYMMGSPRSLFLAGDYLDNLVLQMFRARVPTATAYDLADLKFRIRNVKEFLFKSGYVEALGVRVTLDSLERSESVQRMVRQVRSEIQSLISLNQDRILTYLNARINPLSKLEIVMAGGGATISFLCNALNQPYAMGSIQLPTRLSKPDDDDVPNLYDASRDRLAVSLGGASERYDECQHQRPEVKMIRRGAY